MEWTNNDGLYTVRIEPKCLEDLGRITTIEEYEARLSGLINALSKNPHQFKTPDDKPNWFVAIALRHQVGHKRIPTLRFYGKIKEAEKQVILYEVDIDDPNVFM
jgi:hypothetical protein